MRVLVIPLIGMIFLLLMASEKSTGNRVSGNPDRIPAFPGAEGAGMFTTGGRGGKTLIVDNLNDDGPGSLRDAIRKNFPRTIVFHISGTIELQSPLEIKSGNLTIAGQTAPGDGICLKKYPLIIHADNIIIRYIRIRLGDESGMAFDCINSKGNSNIIIDHCSFSWSVDETASFYDNENFTLQWCIISESLDMSVHKKGEHGYGGIWGGMNASFHHNLLAHHISRNPRLQGSRYHHQPEKECAEMVNNIVYNWRSKCIYGGEQGHYNLAGNYFKPGPATARSQARFFLEPYPPYGWFYLSGNVLEGNDSVTKNNRLGVETDNPIAGTIFLTQQVKINPSVVPEPAKSAFEKVLSQAGASLKRDTIDSRIVYETLNSTWHCGTKGIINTQNQAGGWPVLKSTQAPEDTDMDGIPDSWERQHNLNPQNPMDASLNTLNHGYTNLEMYINSLVNTNNHPVDK